MSAAVDGIVALFLDRGDRAYLGEPVSMTEHMLQTACAAEGEGAPAALVAAALLHDVGHLVHGMADDAADHGIDTGHEEVGARWLSKVFDRGLTEPIRLHVAAKRYLCAIEPTYLDALSPASVHSLQLQGGPFSPQEADEFAASPFADDAIRLRRWDDTGKVAGRATPRLEHYRAVLESCLTPRALEHAAGNG